MSERKNQPELFHVLGDGSMWVERQGGVQVIPPKVENPKQQEAPQPKLPPVEYFQKEEDDSWVATSAAGSASKYDR